MSRVYPSQVVLHSRLGEGYEFDRKYVMLRVSEGVVNTADFRAGDCCIRDAELLIVSRSKVLYSDYTVTMVCDLPRRFLEQPHRRLELETAQ